MTTATMKSIGSTRIPGRFGELVRILPRLTRRSPSTPGTNGRDSTGLRLYRSIAASMSGAILWGGVAWETTKNNVNETSSENAPLLKL